MDVTLTIALAQVQGSSDPFQNLEKAHHLAARAAQSGTKLLVFPEMFMGLPKGDQTPVSLARHGYANFLKHLSSIAIDSGLNILAGIWEPSPDSHRAYNTAVLVDTQGKLLATYRKLHLFDALNVRESDTMKPGDAPPFVVSVEGFRVGVAICYDLRFPEVFRYLADQGAQLIVVPAGWYQGSVKEELWLTLLQARAVENTVYIAGCNLIGHAFCGRSTVFDPFGIPIATAIEGEDCIIAVVSSARLRAVREKLPCLENRRRDLF
ncbi:MAG: carbon-nitrogen hydrolase family protein [Desulfosoma sp.]